MIAISDNYCNMIAISDNYCNMIAISDNYCNMITIRKIAIDCTCNLLRPTNKYKNFNYK